MIISKTPFRISFLGGGSDFKEFFQYHHGSVISTSIDKYCYVTVRRLPRFFEYHSELVYSKMERVYETSEIKHPAIRNAMEWLDIDNIRLTYEADLPARSGLGTSSSFAVGMLNAFYALKGLTVSKEKLAEDAIYLERVLCNEAGGWQDQIAVALGGFNRIDFFNNQFEVRPISIDSERKKTLNNNLMLFFTGFSRISALVHKDNKKQLDERCYYIDELVKLVDKGEKILEDSTENLDEFGYLLDATWQLKKKTGTTITNDNIDNVYYKAIQAGALGGKILGAGGGGFIIFYVQPDYQASVKKALNDFLYVPFTFENIGSQIIYKTKKE